MRIREATKEDKLRWDTFVETEGGSLNHYYDWKYFFEALNVQFIPLIIENDASQLVGILPIIKEKRLLYSKLNSDIHPGGLFLKKDLSEKERDEAISKVLECVDTKYSKRCSRFVLSENLNSKTVITEEPTAAFSNSGYNYKYDPITKLPSTFFLMLEQPFEEKIWWNLWSHKLRNKANKAERLGTTIIDDQEFTYIDDFIKMFSANYERHGTPPLTKKQVMIVLNMFKDRAKLFIALQGNQPIMGLLVIYHLSECVLWELGSYTKDTNHANLLMYKKVIEDACNLGYKYVNFGWSGTPGLAWFKQQFRCTRSPFRTYEKKYSLTRLILEYITLALERTWYDKAYLWRQRNKLWQIIPRR